MKSKLIKISSILLRVILALVIIITSVFVFITLSSKNDDGIPKIFGYSQIVILSDSMKGTKSDNFSKGDLVFINSDVSNLKKGDIITFRDIINARPGLNTHRIVKIEGTGSEAKYYTKGDNNSVPDDGSKSASDIIGVYKSHISGAGNVMSFLGSKWGFLFCMVLPLFIFFVWRLIKLVIAVVDYRKGQLEEKTTEVETKTE